MREIPTAEIEYGKGKQVIKINQPAIILIENTTGQRIDDLRFKVSFHSGLGKVFIDISEKGNKASVIKERTGRPTLSKRRISCKEDEVPYKNKGFGQIEYPLKFEGSRRLYFEYR